VCPWAASEFRAGNDARAEELLAQIKNGRSEPLSIAFLMLGYAIRLKLPKKVKSRFEREFNALLKEPPTGQTVAAVADTVSTLSKGGIDYPGLKPQLRKVLAFIDRAAHVEFSETQLQQICDALVHLDAKKSLPKYFMLGQKGFPKNPLFFLAEVDFQLSQKSCRINAARVREALEKVRELAAALPSSDRDGLLNQVRDRDEKVKDMDPFGFLLEQGGMANAFSEMFGDAFGDDDDDDDYPFDDDDDS
jgi:hypothetical protein